MLKTRGELVKCPDSVPSLPGWVVLAWNSVASLYVWVLIYFVLIWFGIFVLFWPCQTVCRILGPQPGIEPGPLQWKRWVLTMGPPGSSHILTWFWSELDETIRKDFGSLKDFLCQAPDKYLLKESRPPPAPPWSSPLEWVPHTHMRQRSCGEKSNLLEA